MAQEQGSETRTNREALEEGSAGRIDPFTLQRYGSQLTVGTVFGFASAKALKFFGNVAVGALGTAFACAQALSYWGYIDIKYDKASADFTSTFDVDNDGRVTPRDISSLMDGLVGVLQYNLPGGTGFTGAFCYGLGMRPTQALGASAVYSPAIRFVLPRLLTASSLGYAAPTIAIESMHDTHMRSLQERTDKDAEALSNEVAEYKRQLQRMRRHEMDVEEAYLRGRLESHTSPQSERSSLLRAKLQALQHERRHRSSWSFFARSGLL